MKYFFYEVVLPVLLVVLVYFPGGVTLLRSETYLFEKVFSTGDLLGIGVLILINSFVELDKAEKEKGVDAFGPQKAVIVVSGLVIFATYLFIKASALHFNFEAPSLPQYIDTCAWTSMGCLAFTAFVGGVSRWFTSTLRRTTSLSGGSSQGATASSGGGH